MTRHPDNASNPHHAFEAIQIETSGREALLATFRVTQTRSADDAYDFAEALCEKARQLPHRPKAFVREINNPNA